MRGHMPSTADSRRNTFVLAAFMALAVFVLSVPARASAAPKPPVFEGNCAQSQIDPLSGTCVLDEPEGQNPDVYGTVTYTRATTATTDTISFDLPAGLAPTEVQVCLTLGDDATTNPYVPTDANTCAGKSADRALTTDAPGDPVVVDVAAFFASNPRYAIGDAIWFTVHVVADGRTLAVTGVSAPVVVPPAAVYRLTVRKDVVSPTQDERFIITVSCPALALKAANTEMGDITYFKGNATMVLGDFGTMTLKGLPGGTTCTIEETLPAAPDGSWTTTIDDVVDADAALTVTLTADREVWFRNTYSPAATPSVAPETSRPAVAPAAVTPTKDAEVLGVQLQREQLAATGTPASRYAVIAITVMLLGAALLAASRRHPAV